MPQPPRLLGPRTCTTTLGSEPLNTWVPARKLNPHPTSPLRDLPRSISSTYHPASQAQGSRAPSRSHPRPHAHSLGRERRLTPKVACRTGWQPPCLSTVLYARGRARGTGWGKATGLEPSNQAMEANGEATVPLPEDSVGTAPLGRWGSGAGAGLTFVVCGVRGEADVHRPLHCTIETVCI